MDNLTVRPYQPDDEKAVIQLWSECRLLVPQNNPASDIQRKLKVNPEWFLVGVIGSELVATCMVGYDGHRGWINYLAVSPSLQRRGLATRMMREAEKLLRTVGCAKINLQVRQHNHVAIKFYEKIGYSVDAVVSLGKRLEKDELLH
jgi:ribosomal protein S18 acetylase RimI-like enzyme